MTDAEKQKSDGTWYIKNGVKGFDLNSLPRCSAIAKSTGKRCRNPTMKNHDLCCVHAGLYRPGAPTGNKNSLKHGLYTADAIAERKKLDHVVKEMHDLLDALTGSGDL
jgi:glucans biosynthesis protein